MSKPNIILINCDDLGYGDLGCYGSPINKTPRLDQMAREGMKLTDFYMASPICSPSRAAMMTGCYPKRIGLTRVLNPGNPMGLNPNEITVASKLKEAGYATGIVGKWHCGDQPEFLPTRHGFDEYFGLPYSNDMGVQNVKNWDRPGVPLPLLDGENVVEQQPDQTTLTDRYVERAVQFMRAHQDEPFFLYFAHMHVHLPYYVAPRFLETAKNGPYGACVEAVDWSVGVILDELKQLGIDENTWVIFTSDNGSRGDRGGSNKPLRGGKFTTWEGGQRLPCIVRKPGVVAAGTTCDEVATSMDFLPTFCRLAGVEAPTDRILDGKDIVDLLTGQEGATSPHEVFFYYIVNQLEAVRKGHWKLHVAKDGEETVQLYDLSNDLGETLNVAARYPDIVAELQQHIADARADMGDELTEIEGANCRPIGRVENPSPLTKYDPNCPYTIAEYDLTEKG